MEAGSAYFKIYSSFVPWKYKIILIIRKFRDFFFLQAAAEQMVEY